MTDPLGTLLTGRFDRWRGPGRRQSDGCVGLGVRSPLPARSRCHAVLGVPGTSGTHSIIDMHGVVPADLPEDEEEFGTIRLLADAEYIERFGMAQPGRA